MRITSTLILGGVVAILAACGLNPVTYECKPERVRLVLNGSIEDHGFDKSVSRSQDEDGWSKPLDPIETKLVIAGNNMTWELPHQTLNFTQKDGVWSGEYEDKGITYKNTARLQKVDGGNTLAYYRKSEYVKNGDTKGYEGMGTCVQMTPAK